MLSQLDTLIGFAMVMAVVSLLITIVTQMVSAILGLRGKYLADALETMIHKIDPSITDSLRKWEDSALTQTASNAKSHDDLGKELSKWILMAKGRQASREGGSYHHRRPDVVRSPEICALRCLSCRIQDAFLTGTALL